MSYTPKTWQCGEIITAAAMNNIEDGVQEALEGCGGGSDLYRINVNITPQEVVQCDTSFEDIMSAHDDDGKLIIDQFGYVYNPNFVDDEYVFAAQQMRVLNGTLIVVDVTLSEQQNTAVINQYELNSSPK